MHGGYHTCVRAIHRIVSSITTAMSKSYTDIYPNDPKVRDAV